MENQIEVRKGNNKNVDLFLWTDEKNSSWV